MEVRIYEHDGIARSYQLRPLLHAVIVAGLLVGSAGAFAAPTGDACENGIAAATEALSQTGLDAALQLFADRVRPSCTGAQTASLARTLATRQLARVDAAEARGASLPERLQMVAQALERNPGAWQLLERQGDLFSANATRSRGGDDLVSAMRAYSNALDAITGTSPRTDEVFRLHGKAEQTALLVDHVDETVRGFDVFPVAVPLQFLTGNDQLTARGRSEADSLLVSLRQQGFPQVHLVGHTDSRGAEDYNQRLSLARARAVMRYFEARGYPPGRVTAEGRGSKEPYQPVPIAGVTYSLEQRQQMDRRVELVRN